jgi:hypothetical protein
MIPLRMSAITVQLTRRYSLEGESSFGDSSLMDHLDYPKVLEQGQRRESRPEHDGSAWYHQDQQCG